MRKYTEIIKYTKKEGGGSFYGWIDVEFDGDCIDVKKLHATTKSNKPPIDGSGSAQTYSIKEAKALLFLLKKAIRKATNK
jgi:hypothetical protein